MTVLDRWPAMELGPNRPAGLRVRLFCICSLCFMVLVVLGLLLFYLRLWLHIAVWSSVCHCGALNSRCSHHPSTRFRTMDNPCWCRRYHISSEKHPRINIQTSKAQNQAIKQSGNLLGTFDKQDASTGPVAKSPKIKRYQPGQDDGFIWIHSFQFQHWQMDDS